MTKTTSKKDNKNSEVTIVGADDETAQAEAQALPKRNQPVITFEAWWMQAQSAKKLAPHMKEAIYKHFKARGFLATKKYDDGLRDFGC